MIDWLGNWWNGVELWLTQLWFPFQFAMVMLVLLPLCLGVAWLIDRVVDLVPARLTRVRDAQPPVGRSSGEHSLG
ncbi:MAG: hypothetical protein ACRDQ5_03395 [Sciscionella sp.]